MQGMGVHTTRTFRSGNSVAVRLPRELGFSEDVEVQIAKEGDRLVIRRKPKMTMKELVEELRRLPKPATVQEREPIEWPHRPGL